MKKAIFLFFLTSPAMASITFQGFSQGASTNCPVTTLISVPAPTTTLAGDLLIAQIAVASNSGPIVAPSGWINAVPYFTGDSDEFSYLGVWYKIATSVEPSTYTFVSMGGDICSSFGVLDFSGVNNTSPFDVIGSTSGGVVSSDQQMPPNPINTTINGDYVIYFLCQSDTFQSNVGVSASGPGFSSTIRIGQSGVTGSPSVYSEQAGPFSPGSTGDAGAFNYISDTLYSVVQLAIKPLQGTLAILGGKLAVRGGKMVVQ